MKDIEEAAWFAINNYKTPQGKSEVVLSIKGNIAK